MPEAVELWLEVTPLFPDVVEDCTVVTPDGPRLHLRYVRSECSSYEPHQLVWRCEYPNGDLCWADPAYVFGLGQGRLYLKN